MTDATITQTPTQAGLRQCDFAVAVVVILWTSEAFARVPAGSLITAAIYAYFALRFLMTFPRLLPHVGQAWPVFLYPLAGLASVTWSAAPMVSLVGSIQMAFTLVVAIFIGVQFGIRGLARIVALALTLAMIFSAVNLAGFLQPVWSWEGGFLGIFTNKNALGQRAALLLLTLAALVAMRGVARGPAMVAMALTVWMLVLSRSATGQLVGISAAVGFTAHRLWVGRPGSRIHMLILTGSALALCLAVLVGLEVNPIDGVFAAFGKNHTLTGRTLLWDIAWQKVSAEPLLGQGYLAYWSAPAFAQETRLIAEGYGGTVTSFHNFVLEVLVMTGIPGIVAMASLLAWTAHQLVRAEAGPARDWAVAAVGMIVLLSLFGSSLYRPHEISLFLVVALGAAARQARRAAGWQQGVRSGSGKGSRRSM